MSFSFASLETEAKTALQGIEAFFSNLVTADLAAVLPIAQGAVSDLILAETQAVTTGNSKSTGTILASAVKNTEAAVAAAGIQTTASTILAAVGASLHKSQ